MNRTATRNLLLLFSFLFTAVMANGQIFYQQNWDANTTLQNWTQTGAFGSVTNAQSCSGNTVRANVWSGSPAWSFVSPGLGSYSGSDSLTFQFDYKVTDWSAGTNPTPANFGTISIEYSSSATGPWTALGSIGSVNHTPSATCSTVAVRFVPATAGPLFVRFNVTWASGDYWMNFDNVSVIEDGICFPSTIDSVVAYSIDSVAVFYTPNGNAQFVKVTYGETGFTFPNGNSFVSDTNTNPIILSAGFFAGFGYDFYIQDSCGVADLSFVNAPATIPSNSFGSTGGGFGGTYCNAGPTSAADSDIRSVVLNGSGSSISNFPSCAQTTTGVQNFTSQSADVIPGQTYTLTVEFGTCGGNFGGAGEAWIDWNQNGTFESSESVGTWQGTPTVIQNFTFTVDTTYPVGLTRMRVMQQESGFPPLNPCGTYTWGAVHDYSINVVGTPPSCPTPRPVSITNNLTSFTLDIADTLNTGATYEVYYGLTGTALGAMNVLTGVANNSQTTVSNLVLNEFYSVYVRANCGAGDFSGLRGPLNLNTLQGTECNTAFPITSLPFVDSARTTAGYGNFVSSGALPNGNACGSFSVGAEDFLYTYIPSVTQSASVSIFGATSSKTIVITEGCPNDTGSTCVAFLNFTFNGSIPKVTFEAGKVYYITVDNASTFNNPDFGLNIQVLPQDLAINNFTNPVNPVSASFSAVQADVINNGGNAIAAASFTYEVNGSAQPPVTVNFTPVLQPGDTANVTLGGFNFTLTPNDLTAYITAVDGVADSDQNNDTIVNRFCGPIAGTFTVGAATSNFPTLEEAIAALGCGISGPVVFQLAPGTYSNAPYTFGNVVGSSSVNTITIDGGSASNVLMTSSAFGVPVIRVDNGSNYTFRNLSIEHNYNFGGAIGVLINNQSSNVIIENCVIDLIPSASSGRAPIAITNSTTSTTSTGSNADMVIVRNNTLRGGYQGVSAYGSISDYGKGLVVNDNVIEAYFDGVLTLYMDSIVALRNTFSGFSNSTLSTTSRDAISISSADNVRLERNAAKGAAYGIFLSSVSNARVVNNIATATGTAGLYNSNVTNSVIYHNSVSGPRAFQAITSANGNTIRNNIFRATGTATTSYAFDAPSNYALVDNNVYFAQASPALRAGTTTYPTLSAWQAASTSNNVNSVYGDPQFINDDLVSLKGVAQNDIAAVVGVPFDFNGTIRSLTTPDAGAYEFTPINLDLELVGDFSVDPCPSPNDTLGFQVTNVGLDSIDFSVNPFDLNWFVTGAVALNGAQTVNSGVLRPGDSLSIVIAPLNLTTIGTYNVDAYLTSTWDDIAFNDTLSGGTFDREELLTVSPDTLVTVNLPTQTVELKAESPLFGGSPRITEICHFKTTTGAPVGGWGTGGSYPWLASDDYIEITGPPGFDLGGYTLEQWSTSSLTNTFTFPFGTILSPQGTAVIVVGSASGSPSPANFYYFANTSFGYSSGGAAGRIIKDASGAIVDAVGYATYTFPVASGVTTADWSGVLPGGSGTSGIRLIGDDINSATNWVVSSSTFPQDPGVVNSGFTPPAGNAASGYYWTLLGGSFVDSNKIVTVSQSSSGLYQYVFNFPSECGLLTDTVNILADISFGDLGVDSILSPVDDCNIDTVFYVVTVCNYGADNIAGYTVNVNANGNLIDTLISDTLQAQTCIDIAVGYEIVSALPYTINNIYAYTSYPLDITNGNDTAFGPDVVIDAPPASAQTMNDTVCEAGGDAMLIASGNGTIIWYDSLTGGNVLGVGDTLVLSGVNSPDTVFAQVGNNVPKIFFTEICHFKTGTGSPAGGWGTGGSYPWLIADDYIELSGPAGFDIGGYTIEHWTTTSLNYSYTFPSGTVLSPNGTAIIAIGQLGSSVPSPANFYYHGTGTFTGTFGSGTAQGRVLKDVSGQIVDAVGYSGSTITAYNFPAASGVTVDDWSGSPLGGGSTSGTRLIGEDLNNGSTWVVSSAVNTQDPNVINPNVVALPAGNCVSATRTPAYVYYNGMNIDSVLTTDPANCFIPDGSIEVFATQGNIGGSVSYSIDGGATFQASSIFNNLTTQGGGYDIVIQDGFCAITGPNVNLNKPGQPLAPQGTDSIVQCANDVLPFLTVNGDSGNAIFWYADAGLTSLLGTDSIQPASTAGVTSYYATQSFLGCEGPSFEVKVNLVAPAAAPMIPNDTTVCEGELVELIASTGADPEPKITEICHFRTGTGAPTGGWPAYLTSDDYIEISGAPGFDLGGYVLEQWSTTGLSNTHTFPSGTVLSPQGTAIVIVGSQSGSPSPADYYYFGNTSLGFASSTAAGRVLKNPSGAIVDAVGYSGSTVTPYNFPAASGVSAADWSNSLLGGGSSSGIRLEGPDDNTGGNWVLSATSPQTPNVPNPGVVFGNPVDWFTSNALDAASFYGSGASVFAIDTNVAVRYWVQFVDNNGCNSEVDSVLVSRLGAPAAPTLSGNAVYCFGDAIMPFTATGSGGVLTWYSDAALNNVVATGASFTPTVTGPSFRTFYVTETNAVGCPSEVSTVTLTVNPSPQGANLGADVNYCDGDTVAPITTGNIAGTTTNWYSDAALNNVIATGNVLAIDTLVSVGVNTFYATLSVGSCVGTADSIKVTVNAIPAIPMVSNDTVYCASETKANLMAMGGTGTIQWSTSPSFMSNVTTGASLTPAVNGGTYYVRENLNGCVSEADSVSVEVLAEPSFITFTVPTTACNATDGEIEIFASGGTGGVYTYTVTRGANVQVQVGDSAFDLLAPGAYSVSVADTACSSPAQLVNIAAPGQPVAPVSAGNAAICDNEAVPFLVASAQGSGTLNWYSDASLTNSIATSVDSIQIANPSTGVNTVYVAEDDNGCLGAGTAVTLTVTATPSAPTASADASFCFGDPITNLTVSGSGGVYTWYTDAALTSSIGTGATRTPTVFVPGVTTYYVTETVNGCVSAADSVVYTINTLPTAPQVSANAVACFGDVNPSYTATGSGGTINWYSNAALSNLVGTGSSFTPAVTNVGTYNLFAVETSVDGCIGGQTARQFTINPTPMAPMVMALDTAYCDGDMVDTLMVMGSTGALSWKDGSGNALATGMQYAPSSSVGTQVIRVTETNAFGCESDETVVTINVFENPVIDSVLVTDVTGSCIDPTGSIEFFATGGTGVYTYTVISGTDTVVSANALIDSLGSANYVATVSDGRCSVNSSLISIDAPGRPLAPEVLSADTVYCANETFAALSAQVSVLDTNSGSGSVIRWFTDAAGQNPVGTGTSISPNTTLGLTTYYILIDNNGCEGPLSSVDVTVNPVPASPNVGGNVDYCDGDVINPIVAQATTNTITWYSDPALSNQVGAGLTYTPSNSIGTQNLYATATNGFGCVSAPSIVTVQIDTIPTVSFAGLANVCANNGFVSLTGGIPSGGVYSGTGVLSLTGTFIPAQAGVGTTNITYSFTDANGCVGTDVGTITVDTVPVVSFATPSALCANNAAVALTGGAPVGGTYSGNGVTAGSFDPAAVATGNTTLTYTFTDANNCSGTATAVQVVNALPNASAGLDRRVCEGSSVTLAASGGVSYVWSNGTNAQSNPVTPTTTTTYTVTVTNSNGCTNTDDVVVTVDTLPTVVMPNQADVCENSGAVVLSGATPVGGIYTGTNVSGGQFNTNTSGSGSFVVTYSFTDGRGCNGSDTGVIVVNQLPSVQFSTIPSQCEGGPGYTLVEGTPAGGSYSGNGVSAGVYNPAFDGQDTITYTFTDPTTGCSNSTEQVVIVNVLPFVTVPDQQSACENGDPVVLSGGFPAGGNYTGTGVSAGVFTPTAPGTSTISYEFTDATTGCSNVASASIVTNPTPVVSLGNDTTLPNTVTSLTLNPGIWASYVWSDNSTSQTLTVSASGTYAVTITDGFGCAGEAEVEVTFTVGTGLLSHAASLKYYPNPTRGLLNLEAAGLEGKEATVSVITLQGQVVLQERITNMSAIHNAVLDLSGQAQGIYLVRFEVDGDQSISRITLH